MSDGEEYEDQIDYGDGDGPSHDHDGVVSDEDYRSPFVRLARWHWGEVSKNE